MHPKKSKKKTKFHLTKVLSYDMIDEARQKSIQNAESKKIRSTAWQGIAKSKAEKRCSAGEADGSTRLFFFRDILYTLYNKKEKQH